MGGIHRRLKREKMLLARKEMRRQARRMEVDFNKRKRLLGLNSKFR